jgi:sugar O-acyltransferase (sialic acid O-acetyltransferase NeuD family)
MVYILYGVGSPIAADVYEIILRAGGEVIASVQNRPEYPCPANLPHVLGLEALREAWRREAVVVPLVSPGHRETAEQEAREHGFTKFPALIDPSSVVAQSARTEDACIINAGVVVAANCRLGHSVFLNRSTSLGHDSTVGAFATVGPGAVVCGSCTIRAGAFVGAGATIIPKCTIGRNSIVGAGSVVTRDVPDHCVVAGNPAKITRENHPGYGNVSVSDGV